MMRQRSRRSAAAWRAGALATTALVGFAVGCNALLDIDEIEFADVGQGGAGATAAGGTGPGGQGNQGGTGATGTGTGTGGAGNQGIGGSSGGPVGGSGGSGGGSGGATGGSGGSGPVCLEICTNGSDDDGNTLVDCEDPCCSDHRCVPEVPNQWSGPVIVYTGTNGSLSCPGEWPDTSLDGYVSATGAPASCTGCSCGSVVGASCTTPSNSFWTAAGCGGTANYAQAPSAGTCVSLGSVGPYLSARGTAPAATGGSCTPSGGVATVGGYTVSEYGLACAGALAGGGCGGQDVCLPSGEAPFVGSVCIQRNGDRQCTNTGAFTVRHLAYGSISDTRDCSSCTCTATGGSCTGTTDLYAGAGCTGAVVNMANDGASCASTTDVQSMLYHQSGPTGRTCSSGGGSPIGAVTPSDPVTFCCLP